MFVCFSIQEDPPRLSNGHSDSSTSIAISVHPYEAANAFSLGSLRALAPLNSTYASSTFPDMSSPNELRTGDAVDGITRGQIRAYQSLDREDSQEQYEPLTKKYEGDLEAEPVVSKPPMNSRARDNGEVSTKSEAHNGALDKLPPLHRVRPPTREKSKSTYSTPNFKRMLTVEHKKLTDDGYFDEERSKIKVVDSRYKSMPVLDTAAANASPSRSNKDNAQSKEYPYSQAKGEL